MSIKSKERKPELGTVDPTSFSNPDEFLLTDIALFLDVDFSRTLLSGKAHLKCLKKPGVKSNYLVLDIRDLSISKIFDLANNSELEYSIGEPIGTFGSYLQIFLSPKEGDETEYNICIEYETSPTASALQWLQPEQTLGKKEPFLFSQCQAIHCRSIIPCQDTPFVKCPYTAEITAPQELMVLMSATQTDEPTLSSNNKKLWKFAQKVPIPSYLVAIVAGRLKGKLLGLNSKVYAEPEIVEKCVYEFGETAQMLKLATQICGEYVWGRYDLLVLPPSFPFGGMENPCLTFVTPTLLAGDRSLTYKILRKIFRCWVGNSVTFSSFQHVWLTEATSLYLERRIGNDYFNETHRVVEILTGLMDLDECAGDRSLANVVAHEIAHSWSGNLVTTATFEHFWLNEGFTTFIERKIQGLLNGQASRHFNAILGLSSLRDTVVKTLGETHPYTCLVPDLKNVDPDDAFTVVPYEKGHTFLFYLEQLLGGEAAFEKFLKSYIEKFKFKSITTNDFKDHLYEFFKGKKEELDTVDWNAWLYTPGMPPVIPEYDQSLLKESEELIKKWLNWEPTDDCLFGTSPFSISDIDSFTSNQKCSFLTKLLEEKELPLVKIKLMHQVYQMENVMNSEIRFRWLRVCIKAQWKDQIQHALQFVNEQGRMKFVRPIYRDLYAWEEARPIGIKNFEENRKSMMFVLANQLEKDLHLNEADQ